MTSLISPPRATRPDRRRQLGRAARLSVAIPRALLSRMLAASRRSPRFAGIYASRDEAETVAARFGASGYDDERLAGISFDLMCQRPAWDYPVIFWLNRLLSRPGAVLDAGGHMGTKFIAFSELIDLSGIDWTVYDLPGIIRAARLRQSRGELPAPIRFEDRPENLPDADIFLASGLLQYLDIPFADLISRLRRPPPFILLNKVALRDGAGLFTLERIGHARVPYQIRNRQNWLTEIDMLGYEIMDSWTIPDLGHVVPTHPWHGRSTSCGYALRHRATARSDAAGQ